MKLPLKYPLDDVNVRVVPEDDKEVEEEIF